MVGRLHLRRQPQSHRHHRESIHTYAAPSRRVVAWENQCLQPTCPAGRKNRLFGSMNTDTDRASRFRGPNDHVSTLMKRILLEKGFGIAPRRGSSMRSDFFEWIQRRENCSLLSNMSTVATSFVPEAFFTAAQSNSTVPEPKMMTVSPYRRLAIFAARTPIASGSSKTASSRPTVSGSLWQKTPCNL
jgi:hypothetical protein